MPPASNAPSSSSKPIDFPSSRFAQGAWAAARRMAVELTTTEGLPALLDAQGFDPAQAGNDVVAQAGEKGEGAWQTTSPRPSRHLSSFMDRKWSVKRAGSRALAKAAEVGFCPGFLQFFSDFASVAGLKMAAG